MSQVIRLENPIVIERCTQCGKEFWPMSDENRKYCYACRSKPAKALTSLYDRKPCDLSSELLEIVSLHPVGDVL